MKRLITLMLGLALVLGSTAVLAGNNDATTKRHSKTKKAKAKAKAKNM